MQPTSASQRLAAAKGELPFTEEVRDGIWAIAVPLPSRHVPHSYIYVLEDALGSIHLIDAGLDTEDAFDAFRTSLTAIGHSVDDIASVTVTHAHPDHLGLAGRIRAQTGARVSLHAAEREAMLAVQPADARHKAYEEWGVPHDRWAELDRPTGFGGLGVLTVDGLLQDGDRLDIPGRELTVLHTPGHTVGHVCIVAEAEAALFSGDHLLPGQHPGLGLSRKQTTNPVRDYRASLARVEAYPDFEVLPGHGWRFTGLVNRVRTTRAHHDRRTREIAEVLQANPGSTVWEIAMSVTWTAGWENLRDSFLRSAVAQTAWHIDLANDGVAAS